MSKYAIDFDGVLCRRSGFPRKQSFMTDPPMEGALDAIKWILKQGHEVYVCTARGEDEHERIEEWLDNNDFPYLRVTNKKEHGTTVYLDDRAVRFTNWLDFTKLIG